MSIELYKNSFVTLDEANSYFQERFDSDKWFELDVELQEKLLITASKKINKADFIGQKLDESQPMEFPRNFDMPQDIKDAVCEEALTMVSLCDSVHYKNQQNNIKSIGLGSGSISYGDNTNSNELLSLEASYLIDKWVKKGFKFLG